MAPNDDSRPASSHLRTVIFSVVLSWQLDADGLRLLSGALPGVLPKVILQDEVLLWSWGPTA